MDGETLDPLLGARTSIQKACGRLNLNPAVYELLKDSQRVVQVSIPVKMDDGTTKTFPGYRSLHNNALGPAKGGIRFHPKVTREEVMALSMWMTLKCAIIGLPYGGGKGGVTVDPKGLSAGELERLSRGYVDALFKEIGEKDDIPAPDVNTNGQIMAWMADEYIKLSGSQVMGVFTGKPLEFGGSKGRSRATGLGIAVITDELLKKTYRSLRGAAVAVQGFGNVGSFTAKCCSEMGAKVVAVSEWDVTLYNGDGLDIDGMIKYMERNKSLKGFAPAQVIGTDDFWSLEVDVLLPCALENAITKDIAGKIKAKFIVEGANGPTTLEADAVLTQGGTTIVPDILANSGGVTVSYFEWVQNLYGYHWEDEEVEAKERHAMVSAFNAIYKMKEEYGVSMRDAAYMYSVKKISDAMKLRGWY